jgi:hypothetical protein
MDVESMAVAVHQLGSPNWSLYNSRPMRGLPLQCGQR